MGVCWGVEMTNFEHLFPTYGQNYDNTSYELMYLHSLQCPYKPRKGKTQVHMFIYLFMFIK